MSGAWNVMVLVNASPVTASFGSGSHFSVTLRSRVEIIVVSFSAPGGILGVRDNEDVFNTTSLGGAPTCPDTPNFTVNDGISTWPGR